MKNIAIFNCLSASACCSGQGCLQAFQNKSGAFAVYSDENVRLTAFAFCNGCDNDWNSSAAFQEKIDSLLKNVQIIHFGVCTKRNALECPHITKLGAYFERAGIEIVRGTHTTSR